MWERFLADHRDKPSCDSPRQTGKHGPKEGIQHGSHAVGGTKFEGFRRNLIYDMKKF